MFCCICPRQSKQGVCGYASVRLICPLQSMQLRPVFSVTEQQCGSEQKNPKKQKNMVWGKSGTKIIKVETHLALGPFSIWSPPSRSRLVRWDQERERKSLGGDHLLLTNQSHSGTDRCVTAPYAVQPASQTFSRLLTLEEMQTTEISMTVSPT